MTRAVRAELGDRASSTDGVAALGLARQWDAMDASGAVGTALATVTRELRAARDMALREWKGTGSPQVGGPVVAGDPLDELRKRRDVKRAG
jgi:hypothetical protein